MNRLNKNILRDGQLLENDAKQMVSFIGDMLVGEDRGAQFYKVLQQGLSYQNNQFRLIDFIDVKNNDFEVVTEMPCGTESTFRPDITVYINGLPLAFVEAKVPNNLKGMQAEYERMVERSEEPAFRPYLNETQLMIFSNNMEYDENEQVPICGAFYATAAYGSLFFSHFREEDNSLAERLPLPIDENVRQEILIDTNMTDILRTPEYAVNQRVTSPTNRILTSMLSPERFIYLLHYGFNYVNRTNAQGVIVPEKHVMRYQQFFASHAITRCVRKLYEYPEDNAPRGGVIWHTQGSGKTELAYYNARILSDWFAERHISAKFYFIVDRLDLMTQASEEFMARGLNTIEVPNREEFVKNIQSVSEQTTQGGLVMNVVNIQKFSDIAVAEMPIFNVTVQRVYFIDEAHRDFKANGEYLVRLVNSDRNAIKFALTGTPLIGDVKTKDLFGDYIHKYYYNMSIKDGYTLRLIREDIKTMYRLKLTEAQGILEQKVREGLLKKKDITCQSEYVKTLVDYIEEDFRGFRLLTEKETEGAAPVGGMIVCDSSEQAIALQAELEARENFSSVLILSRLSDSKDISEGKRDAFKRGEKDFVVVYNMLLTGFDAPRLKKMYLGRKIRSHNLLQALTRVNRPYMKMRYGYVADFADIKQEFDKTNQAYLKELHEELGDSFEQYSSIFKDESEIRQELSKTRDILFSYDTDNLENFEQQIDAIDEKQKIYPLREALAHYKELANLAELLGYEDVLKNIDKEKVRRLTAIVERRIETLNNIEASQDTTDMDALIKITGAGVEIKFKKIGEGELALADGHYKFRNRVLGEFDRNHDKKDPKYVTLLEELRRVLENHDMTEMTLDEMEKQHRQLDPIMKEIQSINAENQRLSAKYEGDDRFMRIHKLFSNNALVSSANDLYTILIDVKHSVDGIIERNSRIRENPGFFEKSVKPAIVSEVMALVPGARNDPPSLMAFTTSLSKSICSEYCA